MIAAKPVARHAMLCLATIMAMAAVCLAPCTRVLGGERAAPQGSPIDLAAAARIFQEARQISQRDGGRLWGVPLYGPIMLVEPDSRFLVTNQADAHGLLKQTGEVFTGHLPPADEFANTATTWSGVLWTQMAWPLPQDPAVRHTMIAHECFHRIRRQLHLPALKFSDNSHLDTLQGRYLLQLEWRALGKALAASTDADRRTAAADALLFRAQRNRVFPGAAERESLLEYNEGLAEYTGVKAGNVGQAAQIRAAQRDLFTHARDPSFVRSFAYATGPAYGLLLDQYRPGWRGQLPSGRRLDALLGEALHVSLAGDLAARVSSRASLYDGAALLQAETLRERERQKRLAQYRAIFLEHPVLVLHMRQRQISFDPRDVLPFGEHGSVYPLLNVSDDWGQLTVTKAALMDSRFEVVTLPAPTSRAHGHLAGDGWTLALKPGWKLVPRSRKGDFTLAGPDQKH